MRGALLVLIALSLFVLAAPTAVADTYHCFYAVSQLQLVNCTVGCVQHIAADLTSGQFPNCLIHP